MLHPAAAAPAVAIAIAASRAQVRAWADVRAFDDDFGMSTLQSEPFTGLGEKGRTNPTRADRGAPQVSGLRRNRAGSANAR